MTDQAKPTPWPWETRLDESGFVQILSRIGVVGLIDAPFLGCPEGMKLANAELVVLACNWFQEMADRLNLKDVRGVPGHLHHLVTCSCEAPGCDKCIKIFAALTAGGEDVRGK